VRRSGRGARLIDAVERERPDVLLDLDMPGFEPFDAIRELARRCRWSRLIVYTGHTRDDLFDRAFDAGARGYVGKDVEPGDVIRAVREVAAGRVVLHEA
jgi:DNA-binding NarL/FixJ family response regulator